uniref:interleukin-13 receptor subunit alpha-1 n=1 Tax=Euleptes europaea TaxID=460621 RepID=UPI0025419D21|nr:interleukin-13 receptor subunit alpha-1 [Euleptes europaea]
MEAAGLLPLLVAFAGAAVRGALSAWPPNVTYTIQKETCTLEVKWSPAAPPSRNCSRSYVVALRIDGDWDPHSERCLKSPPWITEVPLGKTIDFAIQTSCQKNCEDVPDWKDGTLHVEQNFMLRFRRTVLRRRKGSDLTFDGLAFPGVAGTGARGINCTWWNRNYMECLWQSGENASSDTPYKLFYGCNEVHQCKNVTRNGSEFQCGFDCVIGNVPSIIISVQGSSGNIQPMCLILDSINSLVKLYPPRIKHLSKKGSEVFLNWTEPEELYNLCYEVEVTSKSDRNSEPYHKIYKNKGSATIPVEPDVQHTFRVRVKSDDGQWSDWSEMEVLGGETSPFPILLFILIPLCVALLLVILLIYLKRIKRLLLPKIPDPEQILKYMFQEQNESQPTHETVNTEETHSLMIVEPAGNEK